MASHHQRHQVAETAPTGGHPSGAGRQADRFGQPAAEGLLEPTEAGGEFLGQQIVVEARRDQVTHHRGNQGGRIEMGQSPWVVGVVGPDHELLHLGQQSVVADAIQPGGHGRLHGEAGKGWLVAGGGEPAAQQCRGALKQPLQGGIERLRIGEGKAGRVGAQLGWRGLGHADQGRLARWRHSAFRRTRSALRKGSGSRLGHRGCGVGSGAGATTGLERL